MYTGNRTSPPTPLPPRLRRVWEALRRILPPPAPSPPGEGFHDWLNRAAIRLLGRKTGTDGVFAILRYAADVRAARGGRAVPSSEIRSQIESAARYLKRGPGGTGGEAVHPPGRGPARPKPRPALDEEGLRRRVHSGAGIDGGWSVDRLVGSSPTPPGELTQASVLAALYPDDPVLTLGVSNRRTWIPLPRAVTAWLEDDVTLPMLDSIVPNPLTKPTGVTLDGKESRRCLDNIGVRRYLVLESDIGEAWDPGERSRVQLAYIDLIRRKVPRLRLVMVVDSAGKSLHAWFSGFQDKPDSVVHSLVDRVAVPLGFDSKTRSRCQYVRLPLAVRQNESGRVQRVLYFDPGACIGGPAAGRPAS